MTNQIPMNSQVTTDNISGPFMKEAKFLKLEQVPKVADE